ncbi:MAG: hypothetical protein WA777_05085 [Rhodanobacter sp.]
MQRQLLATAVACSLSIGLPAYAAGQLQDQQTGSPQDQADVQNLTRELQQLKANYAQEVRRLRELDMQVQALQARLAGKATGGPIPAQEAPPMPTEGTNTAASSTAAAGENGSAGSQASATQAQQSPSSRSLSDALQQNASVFTRKLTIENGLTYSWYDRNQLTLNGFLALNAIFLGNIALQDVKSSTLQYDFTTRYGISPRLTLSLDIPYLGRQTAYFQGGAGGSAAVTQEESTSGHGIGDINLSANYKLFSETASRPDTILTLGVVAPTGLAPYGIKWETPGPANDATNGKFAVPNEQPTGNGVWQASIGVSAVKTMDPAIVFANLGYIHSFSRSFSDINTDPQVTTPGSVALGDSYVFGAGVAFAFNERTSLSLSFSDKISEKAELRTSTEPWTKVIGSDANAAAFNLGVTYALTPHTTIVTMLGIGMSPDAPNYTLNFKIPYMF